VPEQSFNLYFTFTQTLGIFLLGMIVMTQALHALAGGTMRNALMKFTRSPLSGAIVGTTNMLKRLAKQLEPIRDSLMTDIALGRITVADGTVKIEALRWLQRVFNHINRISFHLKAL
jgi:hypothetical protein